MSIKIKISKEQQQEAYKTLLNILQEKGKQYVYTQGKDIEWFKIEEIQESPFFEIKYLFDSYVTVKLNTYENGYKEFALKLHDSLCEKQIIPQETVSFFFKKEFEVSSFVMEALNEMYKLKKGGIYGYVSVKDDGSPLSNFRKKFIVENPNI